MDRLATAPRAMVRRVMARPATAGDAMFLRAMGRGATCDRPMGLAATPITRRLRALAARR
jgi:hypothetical protein